MDEGELDRRFHAGLGLVRSRPEACRQYRRRDWRLKPRGLQDLVSLIAPAREIVSPHRMFPGDAFLGEERGLPAVTTWSSIP
jgi:hypothetical protein